MNNTPNFKKLQDSISQEQIEQKVLNDFQSFIEYENIRTQLFSQKQYELVQDYINHISKYK